MYMYMYMYICMYERDKFYPLESEILTKKSKETHFVTICLSVN